jgi:hypothetical protein
MAMARTSSCLALAVLLSGCAGIFAGDSGDDLQVGCSARTEKILDLERVPATFKAAPAALLAQFVGNYAGTVTTDAGEAIPVTVTLTTISASALIQENPADPSSKCLPSELHARVALSIDGGARLSGKTELDATTGTTLGGTTDLEGTDHGAYNSWLTTSLVPPENFFLTSPQVAIQMACAKDSCAGEWTWRGDLKDPPEQQRAARLFRIEMRRTQSTD